MIGVKKCETTGFEPGKSCPGFLYVTLHCWPCFETESGNENVAGGSSCLRTRSTRSLCPRPTAQLQQLSTRPSAFTAVLHAMDCIPNKSLGSRRDNPPPAGAGARRFELFQLFLSFVSLPSLVKILPVLG